MNRKLKEAIKEYPIKQYPFISVIIPVYNSERTIRLCLESIVHQDYPKDKMEVIVVDNDSTDKSKEIIRQYSFIYIFEKKRGVSAARNAGIRKSKGDILLFLDSDCIADACLLKEHASAHLYFSGYDSSIKAVGGGIEGYNRNFWSVCDDFSSWYHYHPNLPPAIVNVHSTANLSITRDIMHSGIVFDESLTYAEDYVFCTCIIRKGFKVYFHPRAKVKHVNRNSFQAAIKHSRDWTKTQLLIRKKGFVNRQFLKNELLILLYYIFLYIHQQFFELMYDILASKRFHFILYFPLVIFIRLQFYYYELIAELRYCRFKKKMFNKKE